MRNTADDERPLDENSALAELERLRLGIEQQRSRRRVLDDEFDQFVRSCQASRHRAAVRPVITPVIADAPPAPRVRTAVASDPDDKRHEGTLAKPEAGRQPALPEPYPNTADAILEFLPEFPKPAPVPAAQVRVVRPSVATAPAAPAAQAVAAAHVAPPAPAPPAAPAPLPAPSAPPQAVIAEPVEPRRIPLVPVAAILIVAAVAAWQLWPRDTSTEIPLSALVSPVSSPPATESSAPAATQPSAPAANESRAPATTTPQPSSTPAAAPATPSTAPVAAGSSLITNRPVWVRVIADGERLAERRFDADTSFPITARETIVIRAGDAGAVRVVVAGKDMGTLGRDGQVLTRTFKVGGE